MLISVIEHVYTPQGWETQLEAQLWEKHCHY